MEIVEIVDAKAPVKKKPVAKGATPAWWVSMSPSARKAYIAAHPNSKFAKTKSSSKPKTTSKPKVKPKAKRPLGYAEYDLGNRYATQAKIIEKKIAELKDLRSDVISMDRKKGITAKIKSLTAQKNKLSKDAIKHKGRKIRYATK